MVVDQIFQRQTDINKLFHLIVADPVNNALDTGGVVCHGIKHLAVGMGKPHIVLEEIDVAGHVSHHHLLGHIFVAFEQIGIRRVIVNHHLVDGAAGPDMALQQLIVLHAEAPMRIARREAAERRRLIERAVIEHFVNDGEEIEAVFTGNLLDLLARLFEMSGKAGTLHTHTKSLRRSATFAEEGADRVVDIVTIGNFSNNHPVVAP